MTTEAEMYAKRIAEIVAWYMASLEKIWRTIPMSDQAFVHAGNAQSTKLTEELEKRAYLAFRDVKDPAQLETLRRVLRDTVNKATDKLDWRDTPPPTEATLSNYLIAMTSCLEATRKGAVRSLHNRPMADGIQQASVVWAALRNARIFDFSFEDFHRIYRAADVYTNETIAGLPYHESDPAKLRASADLYIEKVDEAGLRVPFPDPLPFDHCYIGFGPGILFTSEQLYVRLGGGLAERQENFVSSALLGYMIWAGNGGSVVEILRVVEHDDNYIIPNIVCHEGAWQTPWANLAPWITTHLIGIINEHRQIVLEPTKLTFAQKRQFAKARTHYREPGMLPKPYYTVRMEKQLIDATGNRVRAELARIARELKYRHDRRGHERCMIRRGPLPLEPADAKKLTDAGYKIWTLDEPDSNAYRQLMERGQPPKRLGEWMAILTKWIDATIVGKDREDLPYIPGIRLPSQKKAG